MIHNNLQALRKKAGISKLYVAASVDIAYTTYCKIEEGSAYATTKDIANLLFFYNVTYNFDVDYNTLFTGVITYDDKYPQNIINILLPNKICRKTNIEGYFYVVKQVLSEREINFIELKYKYYKSNKDISVLKGVSESRTRQIISKAIQRLKSADNILFISLGIEKTIDYLTKVNNQNQPYNNVPLSNRTKLALMRNGIYNFDDLLTAYNKDVFSKKKFKGIGKKTIAEIDDCMRDIKFA